MINLYGWDGEKKLCTLISAFNVSGWLDISYELTCSTVYKEKGATLCGGLSCLASLLFYWV
jgi:hypothetical protein